MAYLDVEDQFARNGAAELLQNTGVVDRLLADLSSGRGDARMEETLSLVVNAGGDRFGGAAIARADGGEQLVRSLLRGSDAA